MLNPYCFIVKNGVYEDHLNHLTYFLIFASDEQKAIDFCNEYVKEEVEADKYVNDDGQTVNHWWLHYDIVRQELKEFHDKAVNVQVLD